jgi:hypothetical protein
MEKQQLQTKNHGALLWNPVVKIEKERPLPINRVLPILTTFYPFKESMGYDLS